MISAVAWIRRGVAKEFPMRFEMDDAEYEKICELAQLQLDSAKEDLKSHTDASVNASGEVNATVQIEGKVDGLEEYRMDQYDDEEVGEPEIFSAMGSEPLAVFRDNNEDPFITVKDGDDQDEREENQIRPGDSLILIGRTEAEEQISYLECYVYDLSSDSLYVHHDLMLPAVPLCIEPISYNFPCLSVSSASGAQYQGSQNWCAVGTFDKSIEIWNLDTIDAMYPFKTLPPLSATKSEKSSKSDKKKDKKKKKSGKNLIGHSDAVLALSWNTNAQNFLLSASADHTVILWDISSETESETEIRRFTNLHKDKVSCVKWHPKLPSIFVSAGYDKRLCLVDAQLPDDQCLIGKLKFESDIECISWDHHSFSSSSTSAPDSAPLVGSLAVGLDNGTIHYCSWSQEKKSFIQVLSISAFPSALTSVDLHPYIPGCLVACSAESSSTSVQIWDLSPAPSVSGVAAETINNHNEKGLVASLVATKDVGTGKVFAGAVCPDDPYLAAFGGSLGTLSVWNLTDSKSIVRRFHGRSLPNEGGKVNMQLEHSIAASNTMNANNNQYIGSHPSDDPESGFKAEGDRVVMGDDLPDEDEEEMTADEDEMELVLEEMKGSRSHFE